VSSGGCRLADVADFADLRLDKPDAPEHGAPGHRWRAGRIAAAALLVLTLALLGAYVVRWRRPAEAPPAASAPSAAAPAAGHRTTVEPPLDIAVPPLAESDALVRQLVSQLSSHPKVAAWLTTDHLISNFAVVIQNIADGGVPAKHLSSVKPSAAFAVVSDGAKTYIDPSSYRRYDTYADAFAAIDARGAARLYETMKPRIGEALRDLGDPKGDADATLKRAILSLLATPVIETRIPLKRPGVMYTFEDPALESLTPGQRHLLRMGPRNTRLIQQKLREMAPYVGIDLGR
jgi:hypothetical protein